MLTDAQRARHRMAEDKREQATLLDELAGRVLDFDTAVALADGAMALRVVADTYNRSFTPLQEQRVPRLSPERLGNIHDRNDHNY